MPKRVGDAWYTEGAVAVALTLGIAFIVGQLTTFGRSVDQEFYSAAAQVIPILLLALLVEAITVSGEFRANFARYEALRRNAAAEARKSRALVEDTKAKLAAIETPPEGLVVAYQGVIDWSEELIAVGEETARLEEDFAKTGRSIRRLLLGYVAAAVAGEAAALYALGAATSTTFLVLTAALSLVALVVMFARTLLPRFTYTPTT
jgi:hypothetical protein